MITVKLVTKEKKRKTTEVIGISKMYLPKGYNIEIRTSKKGVFRIQKTDYETLCEIEEEKS